MPLDGEYEISPTGWVRDQTEKIFETGTTESVDINGMAVVLLTTRGAKTGKLRKVPLMRVEHDGVYAIVASLGGAPKHPVWYHNVKADPNVELQDGTDVERLRRAGGHRRGEGDLVGAGGRGLPALRRLPEEDRPPDPGLRAGAGRGLSRSQPAPVGGGEVRAKDGRRDMGGIARHPARRAAHR